MPWELNYEELLQAEDRGEMKPNGPAKQKLEKENIWQRAQHTKLHFNLVAVSFFLACEDFFENVGQFLPFWLAIQIQSILVFLIFPSKDHFFSRPVPRERPLPSSKTLLMGLKPLNKVLIHFSQTPGPDTSVLISMHGML